MDDRTQRLYQAIGRRIAQARLDAQPQLTQEELANRTRSLSRSTVANIENGRQRIAVHHLLEIADALSLQLETLLPSRPISDADQELPDDEVGRRFLRDVLDKSPERILKEAGR